MIHENELYINIFGKLKRGRLEEAIASLDQAAKIQPDKDETWYNRGHALYSLGRQEEVIASFFQASEFEPDDD